MIDLIQAALAKLCACAGCGLALACAFALSGAQAADVPQVSDLVVTPVAPWGVAIDYTLSGSTGTTDWKPAVSLITMDAAGVATTNVATKLVGDTGSSNGAHRVYWNMAQDGFSLDVTNATISVRYTTPDYYVIDLSGGTTTNAYTMTALNDLPDGWQTNDLYKTTQLLLKRVDPGTFVMGADQKDETKRTVVTNAFYLGVFELTKAQWELVTSTNAIDASAVTAPKSVSEDAADATTPPAPVTNETWSAYKYPLSGVSFCTVTNDYLPKLRGKLQVNGVARDEVLAPPTVEQWEYACRAGTTTVYSYGDAANGAYMWYKDNARKAHMGGETLPNAWGFYDMHGNVAEWCLGGDVSGRDVAVRGGAYLNGAEDCTSFAATSVKNYKVKDAVGVGFRLAWSPEVDSAGFAFVTNVKVRVVADEGDMTDGFEIDCVPTAATQAVVTVEGEEFLNARAGERQSGFWEPTVGGEYVLRHEVGDVTLDAAYCVWLPVLDDLKVTVVEGWGVKIDYDLDYSPATTNWTPEIVMISEDGALTNVATVVSGETNSANGAHCVYWNLSEEGLTNTWTNVTFEVRYVMCDTNGDVTAASAVEVSEPQTLTIAEAVGQLVRGTVFNAAGRPCDNSATNAALVRAFSTNGVALAECTTDARGGYVFVLPTNETVRLWAKCSTNDEVVAEADDFAVVDDAGPNLTLGAYAVKVEWDDDCAGAERTACFVSLSAALQCASGANAQSEDDVEVTLHRATTLPWSVSLEGPCVLSAATNCTVACAAGASIYVATNGALTVENVDFASRVTEDVTIVVASNGVLTVKDGAIGLGCVMLDANAKFTAEGNLSLVGDGILLDVGDAAARENAVFGTYNTNAVAATTNAIDQIVCANDLSLVGEAKSDGKMRWRRDVSRVPVVGPLTVTPVAPWGVAIDYTLTNAPTNAPYWQPSVCLVTENGATTNFAATLVGETNCVSGAHRIYWNMAADGFSAALTNATIGVGYSALTYGTNVTVTVVAEGDDLDLPFDLGLAPKGTTSAVIKIDGTTLVSTNAVGTFTWETDERGCYHALQHVVGGTTLAATYFVPLRKMEIDDGTGGKGGAASRFSYRGRFDNKGHNINVVVTNPANAKIVYSLYRYGPYKETLAITNVCNETAVWYKVTAEGYQDYVNWATVTILDYPYWWCRLAPENEAAGLDVSKSSRTYNGYLLSVEGAPTGSFQVKVNKAKKGKTSTKATVTLQIAGEKKQTLRGTVNLETGVLTVTTKDGRTLSLVLGSEGVTGTFDGYELDGAFDVFSSQTAENKAVARDLLEMWFGPVTVMSDAGAFALRIQTRGRVRVVGTLVDGSSVSQSTQLIAGDTCNHIALSFTKGTNSVAFGVWLDANGEDLWVSGLGDTALVGAPGALEEGAAFYLDMAAMVEALGDDTYESLLPNGLSVMQNGKKWILADAENPSALRLTYNTTTGVIGGSFKAYASTRNGSRRSKTVKVNGVLIGSTGRAWATIKGVGAAEAAIGVDDAPRADADENTAGAD